MSTRSYAGRHRGRHRAQTQTRTRRVLHPGFIVPAAAATAIVVTASGASVAQSDPVTFELSAAQVSTARTQAADEVAEQADLTSRRQQVAIQAAAFEGRTDASERAARDKARKALKVKQKAEAAAKARAKAERAGKTWVQPIKGARFTSGFGMRWGRLHAGNDFSCPVGTPVKAMSKGKVTLAGAEGGYGNKVEITYWDGTVSYYAHLSSMNVSVGETVLPGDVVARSGNTGRSTGPHLHLEIHPGGGGPVNPAPWLTAKGLQ